MSVVKVQCEIVTDLDRHRLLHGEAASTLIESYLADARLDLARDALRHASNEVRQTTTSGASIGGSGLAVMGNNPHNRILLARQAISLGNFDLARNLIDEIPFDRSRREGYRDITKRIATEHGLEKAKSWLEAIEDGISKSGGNLGLVEFLVPEPEPMDIPKPWSASC